ncbi:MAG: hypothetical protein HC884_11155 [Chloroflexaceae bacterium]|nr:hypothetical protein [Chloroflexaceae bacterium]
MIIWVLTVSSLWVGCTSPSPAEPSPTNTEGEAGEPSPYPMPTRRSKPSPYPVPPSASPSPSPSPMPTVPMYTEETGAITGILLNQETDEPLENLTVFAATVSEDNEIISYNDQTSSRGHLLPENEGRFTIKQVKPGRYSLALWTPRSSLLVPDPESEDEASAILVTVEPGKVTDVGTIHIAQP